MRNTKKCNKIKTILSLEYNACVNYTSEGFAEKVFHLHVRLNGDWNELYFRNYLIEHKEVAKEYARLKQSLKIQYEHNRDVYTVNLSTGVKGRFVGIYLIEGTKKQIEELILSLAYNEENKKIKDEFYRNLQKL